ncbi:MAG: amidase domain-containing protein [Eubacteriales bacterium]
MTRALLLSLIPLFSVFIFALTSCIDSYKEENPSPILYQEVETTPTPTLSPLSTSVERKPTNDTINNQSSFLTSQEVAVADQHIKTYWQLAYPNHTFTADHLQVYNENLSESDGVWTYRVDFRYIATVNLDLSPENHPLLQGMEKALGSMAASDAALIAPTISRYEETLAESYRNPQEITATYRLVYTCHFDPNTTSQSMGTATYYFQQRSVSDATLMPALSSFQTGNTRYEAQITEGYQAAYSFLGQVQSLEAPTRSVTYQPQLATAYATDHALDIPEYSAENNLGSDCANFVSYCLQAGGITADEEGKWHPSSTAGSYGGINWIRTGYSANLGGVILYMKERNLFFQQENKILSPAGSILFYRDASHVALVTHTDGEVFIFADRSNTTKEYNNFLFEGNFVDYYSPNPQIVVG